MTVYSRNRASRGVMARMEKVYAQLSAHGQHRQADVIRNALEQAIDHNNKDYMRALRLAKRIPVCIDEFVESEDFLGPLINIWPVLRDDLRDIHPDHMRGGVQSKTEVLLGGATGWGKSVHLQVGILYTIYFLSCFNMPQLLFRNLGKYTPIVLILQSVRESVTKRVLYQPIRRMFEDMKFTKKHIGYDKTVDSQLLVDGGIELTPVLANVQSLLGSAVIAAGMDEVNFLSVIEQSKQVAGARGQGGRYDQAEMVYNTLVNRRVSRFVTQGPNPGGIYVSSSVNYEDDFLSRRMKYVAREEPAHVFMAARAQYEARPADTFSGETFWFLIGTDDYPAKVLEDVPTEYLPEPGADIPHNGECREVPIEYLDQAKTNPDNFQREVLGIASGSINRFIKNVAKIADATLRGKELGLVPFVRNQNVDLATEGLPVIIEELLPKDKETPRCVHIDLSLTGDRCGIAMAKVAGYRATTHAEDNDMIEHQAYGQVELAVSIQPSPQQELNIGDVRRWVLALRDVYGLNIVHVSYDGFQSKESQQSLRRSGMRVSQISVDSNRDAYDLIKSMLYEDRLALVDNQLLRQELTHLEENLTKTSTIIDHPPKGSKDISDAVAGALHAAVTARSERGMQGTTDRAGKRTTKRRARRRAARK